MRGSFLVAVVLCLGLPLVSWADCQGRHTQNCNCQVAAPACGCTQPIVPTYVSPCNACSATRCCTPTDYANFTQNFYAEFYARNGWYFEAKAREAAEKRKAYESVQR